MIAPSLFAVPLAAAAGIAAVLLLMSPRRQEARRARISMLIADGAAAPEEAPPAERWYHHLGRIISLSPVVGREESRKLADFLNRAGFRQRGALATFVALKTLAAVIAPAILWRLGTPWLMAKGGAALAGGAILAAAVLGWRLPDLAVRWQGRKRLNAIEDNLPDALDLLVICAEAGLSLDQSLERVAREIAGANPALGEEIATTVTEMRMLSDRWQALDNFATRIGLRSVSGIISTLGQSLRYGTPLAQSLRVTAAEMRTARALATEARAARLPVLLTLPLMIFILPALLLVIGGPAALDVLKMMQN
jgi:tight adherence protein C